MPCFVRENILEKYNFNFSIENIYFYPFHIKENLRLIYVIDGSIQINYVAGNIILKKDDIEFVNCYEPAEIQSLTPSNKVIILEIDIGFLKSINPNIKNIILNVSAVNFFPIYERHKTKENMQNIKLLKRLFINILLNYINKTTSKIHDNFIKMCKFMIENFDDIEKHLSCFTFTSPAIIERFKKIDSFIQENITEKIKLNHLVDLVFLSPQYLSMELKNKYHRTFLNIIEYYRTVEAVRLIIKDPSIKSYDIIEGSGFSSSKYFYRAFRNYMHCTPEEFKKKLVRNKSKSFTEKLSIKSDALSHFIKSKSISNTSSFQINYSTNSIEWKQIDVGFYITNSKHLDFAIQYFMLFTSGCDLHIQINQSEIWTFHSGEPLKINIKQKVGRKFAILTNEYSDTKTPILLLQKGDTVKVKQNGAHKETFVSKMIKDVDHLDNT